MTRVLSVMLAAAVLGAGAMVAQELTTPPDWRWRTDAPARLVTQQATEPGEWRFVAMPPGWHVTTGPGALVYHPAYEGRGNFVLEAEIFLFPGQSQEEYGVFLGGRSLEPATAEPAYVAFVARRDGRGAVLRRTAGGFAAVVDWTANEGIVAHTGSGTAKNVLRVEVGPAEVVFTANGKPVASIPRAGIAAEGAFGFRVGAGVNLHISRLDVTYQLAPPRAPGV